MTSSLASNMAYLPVEWNDDSRMSFMFSAFPENREVNPKHWDSKLAFWQKIIVESCICMDEIIVDVGILKTRFTRNGVSPLGLATVLRYMVENGQITQTEDFLSSVYDNWTAWSYGMAKKGFWWSIGQVWQTNSDLNSASFVIVDLVKKKAELVLNCHQKTVKHPLTDNIVPEKVLKARLQCNNVQLTDTELGFVICQLRKDGFVAVHLTENGDKVIKFADKNKRRVSVVSETDLNVLRLRKAEASIKIQINKLQKDLGEVQHMIVESIKQGSKTKAKKILLRKHILSKTLDKKESLLMNTQDILHRIQDAHSDANIVEAMKAGAQVFKSFSQESGLTIDNVHKIMSDVEEIMDDAAEVDRTISEGSKNVSSISGYEEDSDELERELEQLMIEDQDPSSTIANTETKDILDQLPEVPGISPISTKTKKMDELLPS